MRPRPPTFVFALVALISVGIARADLLGGLEPEFSRRPKLSDFEEAYPSVAKYRSIGGTSVLCCQPGPDGKLNCSSAYEYPVDFGFGAAAVIVSKRLRLSSESAAAYVAADQHVPVVLVFISDGGGNNPAIMKLSKELREKQQAICDAYRRQ